VLASRTRERMPVPAIALGKAQGALASRAGRARRILLVEDEVVLRMSTTDMLERLECLVAGVGSGEEALEHPGGRGPDIRLPADRSRPAGDERRGIGARGPPPVSGSARDHRERLRTHRRTAGRRPFRQQTLLRDRPPASRSTSQNSGCAVLLMRTCRNPWLCRGRCFGILAAKGRQMPVPSKADVASVHQDQPAHTGFLEGELLDLYGAILIGCTRGFLPQVLVELTVCRIPATLEMIVVRGPPKARSTRRIEEVLQCVRSPFSPPPRSPSCRLQATPRPPRPRRPRRR